MRSCRLRWLLLAPFAALTLAIGGVWVRSYWARDQINFAPTSSRTLTLLSREGHVALYWYDGNTLHDTKPFWIGREHTGLGPLGHPDLRQYGAHAGFGYVSSPFISYPTYMGTRPTGLSSGVNVTYWSGSTAYVYHRGFMLIAPCWAILLACLAGLAATAWIANVRGLLRSRRGLCPSCGYDLRGSSTSCPECGHATPDTEPAP